MGISLAKANKVIDFIEIKGSNEDILEKLKFQDISSALFDEGMRELEIISKAIQAFGVPKENFQIDLSIARGLDYYTGTVYETLLKDYPEIGSVCSGGRFDDLAEHYTDRKLPGVGISIGLTRLFFKLKEAGLIKAEKVTPAEILIIRTEEEFISEIIALASKLRGAGIKTEVYIEKEKIGKQLKYASKVGVPFVAIIGEKEVSSGKISLKEMFSGKQELVSFEDIIEKVRLFYSDK